MKHNKNKSTGNLSDITAIIDKAASPLQATYLTSSFVSIYFNAICSKHTRDGVIVYTYNIRRAMKWHNYKLIIMTTHTLLNIVLLMPFNSC